MTVDDRTIVSAGDFGFTRSLAILEPQLQWTDARGSHTYRMRTRKVVGSAEDVDVVIHDPEVSRIHAALEPADDGVWVRDLGSSNGTYIDGIRVLAARVPDGGTVHVGATEIQVFYNQNASEVDLWPTDGFGPLFGRSVLMRALFSRLHRLAQMDSTVLIQGETGTGKELVARAIHQASARADKPLVVVDCGALAESMLEAELFGHTRGAFTGAVGARAGAIEAADGGVVFLDEIGELPVGMQPKLLRAIEGHMVRRIGDTNYRAVDVRFLAATHRDLASMVNAGTFREDLYFRLAVLPVTVPPLRLRTDDIALLAEKLQPNGSAGKLGPELLRELATRPWPGNVRELRNFIERAVALGAHEALAMGRPSPSPSVPPPNAASQVTGTSPDREGFPPVSTDEAFKAVRDRWLDHLEREYLRGMIARHNRDTAAIAQASSLDRSYVYRLIRKHEL